MYMYATVPLVKYINETGNSFNTKAMWLIETEVSHSRRILHPRTRLLAPRPYLSSPRIWNVIPHGPHPEQVSVWVRPILEQLTS